MKRIIFVLLFLVLATLYLVGNEYCIGKGAGWLEYNNGLACGYYLAGEKKSVTVDFLIERDEKNVEFQACLEAHPQSAHKCDPRYIPPPVYFESRDV